MPGTTNHGRPSLPQASLNARSVTDHAHRLWIHQGPDCLMSGLAVFLLKYPSLLQFDEEARVEPGLAVVGNLRRLYGIRRVPSDTAMRERLDRIDPVALQRGKALERFTVLDGHYVLAIDGTGYFSSKKVHCERCCQTQHRNGSVTYRHQMLGAALVHPEEKALFALAPEMIRRQDGVSRNDCERNAAKRLVADFRREHPPLRTIIVQDGLYSTAPHLALLRALDLRVGRSRWRVENEVYNTPGNHGYKFEHNFGHGRQHLSDLFATLTMPTFLIDQIQAWCGALFKAMHRRAGSNRALWARLRSKFLEFHIADRETCYRAIAYGHDPPELASKV